MYFIRFFIFIYFILSYLLSNAQHTEIERAESYFNIKKEIVDTIILYDTLQGGSPCNYLVLWDINSNCPIINGSYEFIFDKITQQDTLVFDSIPYYFKYYKNGKLYLEGLKSKYGNLIGDVKFYRENGKLERIEHYNVFFYRVDNLKIIICDATNPEKKWQFFNPNGSLEKEIEYNYIKEDGEYLKIKTTLFYKRNKKIKSILKEKIKPCKG